MNKRLAKKKQVSKVREEDCWNLEVTLAKLIAPRLVKYKEINVYGYPLGFKDTEEWHEVLDKMIFSFEIVAISKDVVDDGDNWIEKHEANNIKIQEGLDLFAKHFRSLWD